MAQGPAQPSVGQVRADCPVEIYARCFGECMVAQKGSANECQIIAALVHTHVLQPVDQSSISGFAETMIVEG